MKAETQQAHGDALAQALVDEVMLPPRRLETFGEALDLVISHGIQVSLFPRGADCDPPAMHTSSAIIMVYDPARKDADIMQLLLTQFAHVKLARRFPTPPYSVASIIANQFASLVIA